MKTNEINEELKEIVPVASVEEVTKQVVNLFFAILSGDSKEKIETLFADEVDWDMPGNAEKFSWLGKRRTKNEAAAFFVEHAKLVKQEKFEVDFIAVNGEKAVAVGNLSANIKKYNRVYNSEFSAIFKVQNGKIVKYHFLEDSYKLNEIMK